MVQPTPLPKKQLLILCLINLNESIQINVIWPFLPFLVRRYIDDHLVGTFVGLLASSFFLSQLFSSFAWGWASDKIGRRPTLLWGLIGTCIGQLILGLATSYGMAVVGRMVSGILNGNLGVTKTYLGEITDRTNQAKGFSLIGMVWGLGSLVAPLLGGFLSEPGDRIPGFDTEFWHKYPYLLPCLVSCTTAVAGTVLGFCFLPETQAWKNRHLERERMKLTDDGASEEENEEGGRAKEGEREREKEKVVAESQKVKGYGTYQQLDDNAVSLGATESVESMHKDGPVVRCFLRCLPTSIRNRNVLLTTSAYGIICGFSIVYDEVFPLFCETPKEQGGLGSSLEDIGMYLSTGGGALLLYQTFVYHHVCNYFGPRKTHWLFCLLFVPSALAFPLTSPISQEVSWLALFGVVAALTIWRCIAFSSAFTSVMQLINNSATTMNKGQVNGWGQSVASLMRGLGPVAGGSLWSWSVSYGAYYSAWSVYGLVALLAVCGTIVGLQMPHYLNSPPLAYDHTPTADTDTTDTNTNTNQTTSTNNTDNGGSFDGVSVGV